MTIQLCEFNKSHSTVHFTSSLQRGQIYFYVDSKYGTLPASVSHPRAGPCEPFQPHSMFYYAYVLLKAVMYTQKGGLTTGRCPVTTLGQVRHQSLVPELPRLP